MIYSATISDKGQVTLPVKLRERYNLQTGQRVVFLAGEHTIHLQPVEKPTKGIISLYGSVIPPKGTSADPQIAISSMRKKRFTNDV
jgi:AbrB family looped-hinge helix DNA binding protein